MRKRQNGPLTLLILILNYPQYKFNTKCVTISKIFILGQLEGQPRSDTNQKKMVIIRFFLVFLFLFSLIHFHFRQKLSAWKRLGDLLVLRFQIGWLPKLSLWLVTNSILIFLLSTRHPWWFNWRSLDLSSANLSLFKYSLNSSVFGCKLFSTWISHTYSDQETEQLTS